MQNNIRESTHINLARDRISAFHNNARILRSSQRQTEAMIRGHPSLYLLCLTLASNYFARLAPTAAWSISNSRAIPSRTGRLRCPALSSTKPSIQQTAEELPQLVQSGPVSPTPHKSYGKGVWVPPSKNVAQRKGKVFSIRQPQDLLDFVIEDERLSVGELQHKP